eukprot:g7087.t1
MALRRIASELPFRFGGTSAIFETEFCRGAWRLLSSTPDGFRFAKTHEWVGPVKSSEVTVGISDFAQNELGEVVYVEVPEVGTAFNKGETFGVIESVKAASDVYAPVGGEVVEVNEKLADEPGLVNKSPFDNGWIMKMKCSDASEVNELMEKNAYDPYCESLSH